jgi:hypothetical protein
MGDRATFEGDVYVNGTNVRGELNMSGARLKADLNMYGIKVGNGLYMGDARFGGDINLANAQSLAGVTLAGSTIKGYLDMTDATIGDFTIANVDAPPFWGSQSQLDLTNLKATTVHDYFRPNQTDQRPEEQTTWPASVFLAGFDYKSLGIFTDVNVHDILDRPVKWYKQWLPKNRGFSAQPYWHLATVLRESGYAEKAGDILYAARAEERSQAWDRR